MVLILHTTQLPFMRYFFFSFFLSFAAIVSYAQNSTEKAPDTRKVLVIPFEPKLYMSEIDKNVNKETNMNFNQIRNAFRSGLDYSVVAEFRKKHKVISLMSDSTRSVSEQNYIYKSIAYKYEVVPDSNREKSTEKEVKEQPKVQNGQLNVATNSQKKYMNTKITNPNLLTTLNKKYGTEIFIFINELDLKINFDNNGKSSAGTYDRIAEVHYSIYDLSGKLIDSGLATKIFPATVDNPNKIVNSYFSDVAQTIHENFIAATTPKPEKSKGVLQWQEGK